MHPELPNFRKGQLHTVKNLLIKKALNKNYEIVL